MPNINYLGAGASSVEKPKDYFANINSNKTKVNSSTFNKLVQSNKLSLAAQPLQPNNIGQDDSNGTDFALKELSSGIEQQILGIMWNMAFSTIDKEFEGGLGEEIFHKELVGEMVKSINNNAKMGDIATSIYNDLQKTKSLGN